jgi:hypothetical protein
LETQKQVVLEESTNETNNGEHVKGPPVLGLRGCTPVGGSTLSYKFDLGQQNISAGGHLHWDLTLVGDKEWPISYRLCTISSSDASWLSISSCFGVVEALQLKTVKLSFSTKALGEQVFSLKSPLLICIVAHLHFFLILLSRLHLDHLCVFSS